MTGGGQKGPAACNSGNYTLTKACQKILSKIKCKLANHYTSNIARRFHLLRASSGAILIEFAVCMPVLIILLYYINDLAKLKRWRDQTEFVALQMANILQNVAKKEIDEGRTNLSYSAIKHAASLAYLSVFPGTTNFHSDKQKSDLGYNGLGYIFCVQGNADSTASVLWTRRFHFADGVSSPSTIAIDQSLLTRTNVKRLTDASPSEIYPTLKINPGDIKIIVECGVHYSRSKGYGFTDGRLSSQVSSSEAFGLYSLKLSADAVRAGAKNDSIYFLSAVIFKPNSTAEKTFFQNPPSN